MQFVGMGRPVGGKIRTSLECLPILGIVFLFLFLQSFLSILKDSVKIGRGQTSQISQHPGLLYTRHLVIALQEAINDA